MATETATARVELDGQQAENQLKELQAEATKLKKELKQLRMDKDPNYAQKLREFNELDKKIKDARKSTFDLTQVINNLSGASMKELTRAQRTLNSELRNMNRATDEGKKAFAQKSAQLKLVQTEITKVTNQMKGYNSQVSLFGRMAQGFNKYFGIFTAFSASVFGAVLGFRKLVEEFNEYQKSVSNLSALTGLTGNELEWLSDKAKEMSTGMVEGNIRITSTAKEIVDAYTVVGSKMPELLQDQQALNEVTKQAMILAKAGNIDLNIAVDALTNTMNQFRLPADKAVDVINQIAAGAKYGAADIEYISNSVTRFGAAANAMGLDVLKSVALIEVMGKAGLDAEKAGTGLKTFLLKSAQQADEFNVTVVGLDKALHNLKNANLSAAEMTQMFGLEAYIAAQSLVTNLDVYDDLITKLDGTKVAFEMAAVNSDNNAAKLEQARNKAALLRMELGEKLAPALTFSTNAFSYLVKAILALTNNWKTYLNYLGLTIAILAIYHSAKLRLLILQGLENLAMHRSTILLKAKNVLTLAHLAATQLLSAGYMLLTGNIVGASQAMRVFSTIVKTNPLGIMIALLTGVAIAHVKYGKNAQEAKRLEELKTAALEQSNRMYEDVSKSVNNYSTALQNSRYWNNQERIALQESIKTDLEAAKAKLLLIKAKQHEIEQENMRLSLWKVMTKSVSSLFSSSSDKVVASQGLLVDSFNEGKKAGADFDPILEKLTKSIEDYENQIKDLNQTINAEQNADNMVTTTIEQLENKINLYRVALRNATFRSEEYYRIQRKIADTTKELNDLTSESPDKTETVSNAYDTLTKKISEAQKALQSFVAAGDYDGSEAVGNTIKQLENAKRVLDGIIAAGGNVNTFLDNLTDSTQAELDETLGINKQFAEDFKDIFADIDATKKQQHQEELDRITRRIEFELAEERRKRDEKIQLEKDWASAKEQITDTVLNAGFQIAKQSIDNQANAQLSSLQKQKDAELSNKNLTEAQRAKIEEKYRKQEAKIKSDAFKKQKAADIIQSLINGALAVTRALAAPPGWPLNMPMVIATGIAGAAQTAVIAAQKVPQFAAGRYDVIGADDGRNYNVPYLGAARTGIYERPALIAERGPELIVDAPTTKHLRINYPGIIDAIQAARVPQYASGKYPEPIPSPMPSKQETVGFMLAVNVFKSIINDLKTNGIPATLNYQDFRRFEDKVNDTENKYNI